VRRMCTKGAHERHGFRSKGQAFASLQRFRTSRFQPSTMSLVTEAAIRRATPEDIDAMVQMEQATSTAAHWSRSQYQAIFQPDAPPRLGLVADNGQVSGFLVAQAVGPEWELENVVVAPAAQRRGLGTQLVRALVQQAKQQHAVAILLEVRASNAAARRFYEGCGFVLAGTRPRYYQNPQEDAILYRYSFNESPQVR
jgi:[ribosomal protein S18]-alanine N-acetyltransferase